jgi:hypothetical protein
MQRIDCIWLALVAIAALIFSVWGMPFFSQLGHPWLSVPVYAVLVVLFLYGRANRRPRETKLPSKKSK